ncbi:MAG: hypothetical protein WBX25_01340, partial [Rhodomicrobium sp.]
LTAYCELKSPRDDWLDDQLTQAPPGNIVGGSRKDPTFNRLARRVEKAVGQFDRVNTAHELPNILVFVNHDPASHINDLRETSTGSSSISALTPKNTDDHVYPVTLQRFPFRRNLRMLQRPIYGMRTIFP